MYDWIFIVIVCLVKCSKCEPSLIPFFCLELFPCHSNVLFTHLAFVSLLTCSFVSVFIKHAKCAYLSSCKSTCLLVLIYCARRNVYISITCNALCLNRNSLPLYSVFRFFKLSYSINSLQPLLLLDVTITMYSLVVLYSRTQVLLLMYISSHMHKIVIPSSRNAQDFLLILVHLKKMFIHHQSLVSLHLFRVPLAGEVLSLLAHILFSAVSPSLPNKTSCLDTIYLLVERCHYCMTITKQILEQLLCVIPSLLNASLPVNYG